MASKFVSFRTRPFALPTNLATSLRSGFADFFHGNRLDLHEVFFTSEVCALEKASHLGNLTT